MTLRATSRRRYAKNAALDNGTPRTRSLWSGEAGRRRRTWSIAQPLHACLAAMLEQRLWQQRNLLSPLANGGTWTNLRAKSVPGFAGRQSLRSAMQCRIAWLVRGFVRDIGIVAVVARADVGSGTAVHMHLARLDGPRWPFCILHRPLYHSRPTRNACVRWSVETAFGIRAVAGHEECGKRRQVGRWMECGKRGGEDPVTPRFG